jgi:hypothetical protein
MGAQWPLGYGVFESTGDGFVDTMKRGWQGFKSLAKAGSRKALSLMKKHVLPIAQTAGTHLLRNSMQHVAGNLGNIVAAAREGGAKGLFNSLASSMPTVLTQTFMDTVGLNDDDEGDEAMQDDSRNYNELQEDLSAVTGDGYKTKKGNRKYYLRRQIQALTDKAGYAMREELLPIKHKLRVLERAAKKQYASTTEMLQDIKTVLTNQISTTDGSTHTLRSLMDTMLSLVIRMHDMQVGMAQAPDKADLEQQGGFLSLLAGLLPSLLPGIASVVRDITKDIPIVGPLLGNVASAFGAGYSDMPMHYSVMHDCAKRVTYPELITGSGFDENGFYPLFIPQHINMTVPQQAIANMYGAPVHAARSAVAAGRKRGSQVFANVSDDELKTNTLAFGKLVNDVWGGLSNAVNNSTKKSRLFKHL